MPKIYTLDWIRQEAEEIIGDWNGEDDRFVSNGIAYSEDDVHVAQEILDTVSKLEDLIKELKI